MKHQIKYRLFCGLLSIFFPHSGYSQKNITHQQVIWYAYVNHLKFTPKLFLVSEVHERRYFYPDAQHQFAIRERLHFVLNPSLDMALCLAYFLQSPNDPISTSKLRVPELRPHLDINYKQSFKKLALTHRYRIEHRFFRNTKEEELINDYNSNWRFRYQFGIEIPVAKFKNEGGLIIKFGDELLINAGKNIQYNTFDHNRIYSVVSYTPIESLIFEAGYMYWFQQRSSGNDYYERDIIRLSITQKINVKAKK